MKVELLPIIKLVIGFVAGNFIWEVIQVQPNFLEATERSYFQVIIAGAIWWQISCRSGCREIRHPKNSLLTKNCRTDKKERNGA